MKHTLTLLLSCCAFSLFAQDAPAAVPNDSLRLALYRSHLADYVADAEQLTAAARATTSNDSLRYYCKQLDLRTESMLAIADSLYVYDTDYKTSTAVAYAMPGGNAVMLLPLSGGSPAYIMSAGGASVAVPLAPAVGTTMYYPVNSSSGVLQTNYFVATGQRAPMRDTITGLLYATGPLTLMPGSKMKRLDRMEAMLRDLKNF